jgi:hypothetical protein
MWLNHNLLVRPHEVLSYHQSLDVSGTRGRRHRNRRCVRTPHCVKEQTILGDPDGRARAFSTKRGSSIMLAKIFYESRKRSIYVGSCGCYGALSEIRILFRHNLGERSAGHS